MGSALRGEEILTRPEARTIVAEFIKNGLLSQFQAVDQTGFRRGGRGCSVGVQCQVHCTLLIQASAGAAADRLDGWREEGRRGHEHGVSRKLDEPPW